MKTSLLTLVAFLIGAVVAADRSVSAADLVLSPSPVVQQRVVYYGAAPVVAPAPVTTYYAPTTTYYAPSVATSTVVSTPAPTVTYYAPSVTATPVTSFYTPTTTYYAPTTTYYTPSTSYYTPMTTYYSSTAVAATPVVVGRPGVVRSKVYYPYEPVRNFLKAITP